MSFFDPNQQPSQSIYARAEHLATVLPSRSTQSAPLLFYPTYSPPQSQFVNNLINYSTSYYQSSGVWTRGPFVPPFGPLITNNQLQNGPAASSSSSLPNHQNVSTSCLSQSSKTRNGKCYRLGPSNLRGESKGPYKWRANNYVSRKPKVDEKKREKSHRFSHSKSRSLDKSRERSIEVIKVESDEEISGDEKGHNEIATDEETDIDVYAKKIRDQLFGRYTLIDIQRLEYNIKKMTIKAQKLLAFADQSYYKDKLTRLQADSYWMTEKLICKRKQLAEVRKTVYHEDRPITRIKLAITFEGEMTK